MEVPAAAGDEESQYSYCEAPCSNFDCEACYGDDAISYDGLDDEDSPVEARRLIIPADGPLIHYDFENSYLPEVERERRQNGWILHYDRCTSSELKRFVLDRRLRDPFPQGLTLKYFYIRVLEQSDRDPSFRLMDLPPEMRMHVYRPLLIAEERAGWKDGFHPELLRTTKQVNREARCILYHENVFGLEYKTVGTPQQSDRSVRILNVPTKADCPHGKFFRLPHAIDDYPNFLRQVSQIRISLSCGTKLSRTVETSASAWDLNNYLYGLASFLMEGHSLKSLHIEILDQFADHASEAEVQMMLYPLRRLRGVPNVVISGGLPSRIAQKLRKDLRSTEPVFNTMRHWRYLDEEALSSLKLLNILTERACEHAFMDDEDDEFSAIAMWRFELETAARKSCGSGQVEEHFMAKLSELRYSLDSLDVSVVTSVLKQIKEGKQKRRSYEESTDDGRLKEAGDLWDGVDLLDGPSIWDSDDQWSEDEDDEDLETAQEGVGIARREARMKGGNHEAVSNPGLADGLLEFAPQHCGLDDDQIEAIFESWAPTASPGPLQED